MDQMAHEQKRDNDDDDDDDDDDEDDNDDDDDDAADADDDDDDAGREMMSRFDEVHSWPWNAWKDHLLAPSIPKDSSHTSDVSPIFAMRSSWKIFEACGDGIVVRVIDVCWIRQKRAFFWGRSVAHLRCPLNVLSW